MAQKIIKPTQTAFIRGHETIHELHSKKLDGVLFKIDSEKAYDKVKWPFLHQALRMKGFQSNGVIGLPNLYKAVVWESKLMMI
jgi:hypothetical protein